MLTSRSTVIETPVRAQDFGENEPLSFWEGRFLTGWLPVLTGLVLGLAAAVLIWRQAWIFLVPLALLVPVVILFLRYPFTAIMIWVLVFPYLVNEPSTAGRIMYNLIHRFMIFGALGIVILASWFRLRKREPVRFGRAELVMLIFLGTSLLNIVLLSPEPIRGFIRFFDRLFVPFFVYWLIRLVSPTTKDFYRFLPVVFVTLIAQAIIGFISVFAPGVLPDYWLRLAGERTMGSLGNPAVYTSTLIFLSIFLFQYAMQGKSRLLRPIFILAFGITCLCIFLSFSRGSWLGGLLVLTGMMMVYPRVVPRLIAVGLVLAVILGTTVFANQVAFAWERLNTVETAEGRIIGGAKSVQMIEQKPLTGWGYNTYDSYDEQFRTRVGNLATDQEKTSHNTWLTIMAEQGIPAFLLYIFPTVWWLLLSVRVWRRLPENGFINRRLLALLWLLILDHLIVSSFMDMVRFNLFGTTIYWMALGLIASIIYPYLETGDIGAPRWTLQPARSD